MVLLLAVRLRDVLGSVCSRRNRHAEGDRLRYPGRVVGGGGIFLEYDDREVADVASIIADFHEGVQGLVSSTMVNEELKLEHIIRGHHALLRFDKSCSGNSANGMFEFVPERPQVTLNSKFR